MTGGRNFDRETRNNASTGVDVLFVRGGRKRKDRPIIDGNAVTKRVARCARKNPSDKESFGYGGRKKDGGGQGTDPELVR